jgi:hypothetical protein
MGLNENANLEMTSPIDAVGGWVMGSFVEVPIHLTNKETAQRDLGASKEMHLGKDIMQTSEGKKLKERKLPE